MKIKSAVLIGQTSCYLQNDNIASEIGYATVATGDEHVNSNLMLISPRNFWTASLALWRNKKTVPEYWEDKIDSTYLRAKLRNEYLTWQLFIKLNPHSINLILKDLKPAKYYFINELFNSLLPQSYGEPIEIIPSVNTAYILYLEPEDDLLANHSDENQLDLKRCAENLASFLGQDQCASQPNLLHDIFVFHSVEGNLRDVSLTAIRICPSTEKYKDHELVLPDTVYGIGRSLAIIHILRHMKSRLHKLPFIKRTITNYVRELQNNRNLLASAVLTFQNDREVAINEYFRISSLLDTFNAELGNTYVTQASDNGTLIDINTSISNPFTYAHRYNVLTEMIREQRKDFRSVRKLLQKLQEHKNAISDYIRDLASIEATLIGLKLQKRMHWLSLIALFIAIMAIIISFLAGIFPDEIRNGIFEKVVKSFL